MQKKTIIFHKNDLYHLKIIYGFLHFFEAKKITKKNSENCDYEVITFRLGIICDTGGLAGFDAWSCFSCFLFAIDGIELFPEKYFSQHA